MFDLYKWRVIQLHLKRNSESHLCYIPLKIAVHKNQKPYKVRLHIKDMKGRIAIWKRDSVVLGKESWISNRRSTNPFKRSLLYIVDKVKTVPRDTAFRHIILRQDSDNSSISAWLPHTEVLYPQVIEIGVHITTTWPY